jgi:adenylate cyclase
MANSSSIVEPENPLKGKTMKESMTRSYRLTKELSQLFTLEGKIDATLSVSLYYMNQILESERSSIFLFQHWNQELTIFSSLDLKKQEISIPKGCGVAGWVFVNQKPCIVNNAYEDSRFYKNVDRLTGFKTRNLICAPLLDNKCHCLGTIQSLNKSNGDYTSDDLDLLSLAAGMVTAAIRNNSRYAEICTQNDARRHFIKQISRHLGNAFK